MAITGDRTNYKMLGKEAMYKSNSYSSTLEAEVMFNRMLFKMNIALNYFLAHIMFTFSHAVKTLMLWGHLLLNIPL